MPPEPLRLLVDMGVSKRVVEWLTARGYDAVHAADLGMHRATDAELFRGAERDGRSVLTCDLDFGEIVSASPRGRTSVVVLRLHDNRPGHVIERLASVLPDCRDNLVNGAVIVVEETRWRARALPVGRSP